MRSGFLGEFHNVGVSFDNLLVILSYVGEHAVCTILESILGICKVAAAVFAQSVERTITKETIKVFRIVGLVTRKEFAFLVTKECVIFLA